MSDTPCCANSHPVMDATCTRVVCGGCGADRSGGMLAARYAGLEAANERQHAALLEARAEAERLRTEAATSEGAWRWAYDEVIPRLRTQLADATALAEQAMRVGLEVAAELRTERDRFELDACMTDDLLIMARERLAEVEAERDAAEAKLAALRAAARAFADATRFEALAAVQGDDRERYDATLVRIRAERALRAAVDREGGE